MENIINIPCQQMEKEYVKKECIETDSDQTGSMHSF